VSEVVNERGQPRVDSNEVDALLRQIDGLSFVRGPRGQNRHRVLPRGDHRVLHQRGDDRVGEVQRAEAVLPARVGGGGEDVVQEAVLADAVQAAEEPVVQDRELRRAQKNRSVNRIEDRLDEVRRELKRHRLQPRKAAAFGTAAFVVR
jgi:hypothetical protein